jgi:asparagine synthase (glutamine-hydrolysing)
MAGLVGIVSRMPHERAKATLTRMYDLMAHRPSFSREPPFIDAAVCAGRCHSGIINIEAQPSSMSGVHVWFTGEIYNKDKIPGVCGAVPPCEAELVGAFHRSGNLDALLREADGIFTGAIYDANIGTVSLFTDRYGLRYLHYTKLGDAFSWAEEYKAFLGIPGFMATIDRSALDNFLDYGFIAGKATWFEGVTLLDPATILTYDIARGTISSSTYFDWRTITPRTGKFDITEYGLEWGRRLRESVRRRTAGNQWPGIFLSGGLDSRAILASMPDSPKTHAVTFGVRGCDEIRVASRVARKKGAMHHVFALSAREWFYPRFKGIWWSDGELCIADEHGIETMEEIANFFQVSLNGLGGAIHSGYIFKPGFGIPPVPEYPFGQVGRRSARRGVLLEEPYIYARAPLYANDLIQLTLSVPMELRLKGRFYRKALSLCFPEFFGSIPYQATGVPVSIPFPFYDLLALRTRGIRKITGMLADRLPFIRNTRIYADYGSWFKQPPARQFIQEIFSDKESLLYHYLKRDDVLDTWRRHCAGNSQTARINRLLTFELWLRQVFSGAYRAGFESNP